jgi:hypothetical protein
VAGEDTVLTYDVAEHTVLAAVYCAFHFTTASTCRRMVKRIAARVETMELASEVVSELPPSLERQILSYRHVSLSC